MPLHGEHEVIGGCAFEGFDDAIFQAAGDDAQAIADLVRRLMVRRIHGEDRAVAFGGCSPALVPWYVPRDDLRQLGRWVDLDGVRDGDIFSRFMIYFCAGCSRQKIGNVLDKRSGAVHVEALQPVADAQDGLAISVGVVEQEIVDSVAVRIGGRGAAGTLGVERRDRRRLCCRGARFRRTAR